MYYKIPISVLSSLLLVPSPSSAHAHTAMAEVCPVLNTEWTTTAPSSQSATTLAQQIALLERRHKVRFVYDSSLPLQQVFRGGSLEKLTLREALHQLFYGTGIDYELKNHYVLLKLSKHAHPAQPSKLDRNHSGARKAQTAAPRHTLSGYVATEGGERLIHATVRDQQTGAATVTNEHGFYSITLPEGSHSLSISYIGMADCDTTLTLRNNRQFDVTLREDAQLSEVVVTADLTSPLKGTQTGKRTLTKRDIMLPFATFSSPDVVKTLQRMSGVAEGTEMASGLYVHGGGQDENLMLLDGTPLYEVNHSLGLFSAFNADAIKNVDFYKSGFPARYSGRLSSVVDVRTDDGDMERHHWSYRIGIIDGALNLQGPIGHDRRTSYNIALRRSWLDLISRPAFAIYRMKHKDDHTDLSYFFHDLNAKVTHVVSDRSRVSLSVYSGVDKLNVKNEYKSKGYENADLHIEDLDRNRYSWGNVNAALQWSYVFTPQLFANFSAIYTHNFSHLNAVEEYNSYVKKQQVSRQYNETDYQSAIDDGGARAVFDFRPSPRHHIRFGGNYTLHVFRPQTQLQAWIHNNVASGDSLINRSSNRHTSHEAGLWAEDEMRLTPRLSANVGLHASLFGVEGKGFTAIDPRLAVKYELSPRVVLKTSMTQMTQYVHKLTNSYISLPTDYWVPTTRQLRPMRATQLAAGIYSQPSQRWMLSVEGFYKWSDHLLQYANWSSLVPPASSWDKWVMDGRGRSYGVEVDASYRGRKFHWDVAYTLSWSQRRFEKFYPDWYYDKFDSRHKLNITGRWTTSRHTEVYASWTMHTGHRITLPTQLVNIPDLPGVTPTTTDGEYNHNGQEWVQEGRVMDPTFIYEQPNNYVLPLYHRLDLGFNWHKTTRKGHERIWNLSLYNAYSHLNPLYVEINTNTTWNKERKQGAQLTAWGYIPIIPSVSYTRKF